MTQDGSGTDDSSVAQPDTPPPPPPTGDSAGTTAGAGPSIASSVESGGRRSAVKLGVAVVAVIAVLFGAVSIFTGGDDGTTGGLEFLALEPTGDVDDEDNNWEVFLADIKDEQVTTSVRLGISANSIEYKTSLQDRDSTYLTLVAEGKQLFLWNDEDDDEELLSIDKKSGTSTSLYRGEESIDRIIYVADEKTFLINDSSNCFALPVGKAQTRIGSGSCLVWGGRIFNLDTTESSTTLTEVSLDGSSKNKFNLAISSSVSMHQSGTLVSGRTPDGVFEMYSTSDGKRVYSSKSGEEVTVLADASEASALLVAIENPEKEDETTGVGVITVADGNGAYTELTTAYSVSGILSPKGDKAILITRDEDEGERDIEMWTVEGAVSQSIGQGVETIHESSVDSTGRVWIVTDGDFFVGTFDGNLSSRASGNFSGGTVYSSKGGLVAVLTVRDKSDLLYVKDGVPADGDRGVVTIATNVDNIQLTDSSLAVDGYVYYGEQSNSYTDVYRQKLEKDAERVKVGEGRLTSFDVTTSGELYSWEYNDDNVTSYYQKNEKPENRKTVSTRYVYMPVQTGAASYVLRRGSTVAYDSATAVIDSDLKACRSSGTSILGPGDTESFSLTRQYSSTTSASDFQQFCVRNASSVTVTSSSRNDMNSSGSRWIYIRCSDGDSDFSESIERNHGNGEVRFDLPGTARGVFSCSIADSNYYYYSYFSSSNNTFGMQASIRVD